ncbi:Flp family type IVb pilin [Alcaligenaceae bacterium]|nr:Flp family type IVb pilin [Alcaligenaceae bacterium]
MRKFIQSLARDESGVTALEYAILAGIVVAILASVATLSTDVGARFEALVAHFTAPTP